MKTPTKPKFQRTPGHDSSRAFASRAAFMILTAMLLAGFMIAAGASPTAALSPNSAPQAKGLNDQDVARTRGLTLHQIHDLHVRFGLSIEEIDQMSSAMLGPVLWQVDHPNVDLHAEAIKFRRLQLRDDKGQIPADAWLKAARQRKQMRFDPRAWPLARGQTPPTKGQRTRNGFAEPKVAGIQSSDWTWLGPGNIGGRVRSILVHPATPSTMWAGGVGGGIWKTTNSGASWFSLDDFMPNLAISSMAMDPANPDVIYAGTGEGFYNGDAIQGAGIFKSRDGGTNWAQLPSTISTNFYYVNRLAVNPNNTTIVLAATRSGLFRSIDSGTNWSQSTAIEALDVQFHPTDESQCVAGGRNGNALYSLDGGVTWLVASGLPASASGRVEVAYARGSPSTVYASLDKNFGELYRSIDGGQTYSLRNTGTGYFREDSVPPSSQGWYDNCIWVDPTNPNILIVGGIDLWRSADGGSTLTKISQWSVSYSAHADHHIIVSHAGFDGVNNRTVFFGNDGGVYKASNVYSVAIATGWTELNNNLGITEFYGAAGNATSGTVVGGTQDNGTIRYTTAGGTENWTTMFGGDGGFCATDPTDASHFYGEYVFLDIHRSADGGASAEYISGQYWNGLQWVWKSDPYRIPDAQNQAANFIAPFVLDPNQPSRILAGGLSLWRCDNAKALNTTTTGPAWASIKAPTPGNSFISAIAVAPSNSDLIWVGHNDGSLYLTVNGTAGSPAWTRADLGTPNLPQRQCMRITIDRNNSARVFVTFGGFSNGNVWRTTDGGVTWTDISGQLPSAPVHSLVLNPSDSNSLYVGTEVGVFASADGGANWSPNNDGPANVAVDELFWMGNTLVAATHGRGLFSIGLQFPVITSGPRNQNVVMGGAASFTVTASGASPLTYQWQKNGRNLTDGGNIFGSASSTLTLTNVTTSNAGTYSVAVRNTYGSGTSTGALLTISLPTPSLITFDDLSTPTVDTNTGYRSGTIPIGYHNLNWNNFYIVAGATITNSGYTPGIVSPANVSYNGGGSAASITCSSTFSMNSAYLTAAWRDNLQVEVKGYAGASLTYDHTYTLSATAPTLIPLNYNAVTEVDFVSSGGTPHPGYTFATYQFALDNVSVVTNLPIVADPQITTQPQNQAAALGANVVFSVGASGTAPINYQWQKNGTNLTDGGNLSGCITANLSVSGVSAADAGIYSVTVTSPYGSSKSDNALLVIAPSPVIFVTTTDDSGPGSLRDAILAANATVAVKETILFDIPGTGVHTITPSSPLPTITDPVIIDGYSQPGSSPNTLTSGDNAILRVEVSGASAGANAFGLYISAGSSTVRGLAINAFRGNSFQLGNGISITGPAGGTHVEGNFIGTDVTGSVARTNQWSGISIVDSPNNVVGGTTPAARNVISGNAFGVALASSNSVATTNNWIQGNFIGTDYSGLAKLSNAFGGVVVYSYSGAQPSPSSTTIGGTVVAARNVISGNGYRGVYIGSGGTANEISGNFIGTDVTGTSTIANGGQGVELVNATQNFIGRTNQGAANVISGNSTNGVLIAGSQARGNLVQGNFIGTDVSGTLSLGNAWRGVEISSLASSNTVGGTIAGAGNVISGNLRSGVIINGAGANGNLVQGNFIGIDASGRAVLANSYGVYIGGGSYNAIGGSIVGARNTISGNTLSGVEIADTGTGNLVQGNFVGTDASGTLQLPNGGAGVLISNAPNNTVGGSALSIGTPPGNLISGNNGDGIRVVSIAGTLVDGNLIGTDAAGVNPLGNLGNGVVLTGTINGVNTFLRNVISANFGDGFVAAASGATTYYGGPTFIGTDATATRNLGNHGHGLLAAAPGTFLADIAKVNRLQKEVIQDPDANRTVVAFNWLNGATILPGSGRWSLAEARFFSNGLLGIDLGNDGVTLNDPCDTDTGANSSQNYPVLSSAILGANGILISGSLDSVQNTTFELDFYANPQCNVSGYGEGENFLGSIRVTNAANCVVNFQTTFSPYAPPPGPSITATATRLYSDGFGETSEFSQCIQLTVLDTDANGLPDWWEQQYFGSPTGTDPNADPDGDGLSNLMEYALGTDPRNPADAKSGMVISIIQGGGGRYSSLQFKRRTNTSGLPLQYLPEVSSDRQTWYSDSSHVLEVSVTPLDAHFDWVTVRDLAPITPTAPRLLRLRVVSAAITNTSPVWVGTDTLINGNAGNGSKFTAFSQRVVQAIQYAGKVSSLQNRVLTDTNATWGNGQFGTNGILAYVEFDNGWMADIADTSANSQGLTLAGNLGGVVSVGDAYRVHPHFTIASLFGTNNETGLKTGLNPAQADTILLGIPQTQQTMTIFYFSNAVAHGWYRADFSPAADQVVYPEQGMMVRRLVPGDVNLYACGPVKAGVTVVPIEPGFNLVGTLKSLSTLTLSSLNLYTGDPSTGVASGLNLTTCDNILVVQPDGSTASYFYFKNTSYEGWLDAFFNPAGNTPIPAGSAFFIKRHPANGPFNWTIPVE